MRASAEGKTKLSAFHNALKKTGMDGLNLIYLSSIIPKDASIIFKKKIKIENSDWGSKGYVVMSRAFQTEKGREAWAGLGHIFKKNEGGIFFEESADEKEKVKKDISIALENERRGKFSDSKSKIITNGKKCKKDVVCSLVCALYDIEKWE